MTQKEFSDVQKRLQTEIMGLVMNGIEGIRAFPERKNILKWKAEITCSKDHLFAGTKFTVSLDFPVRYPHKSPNVSFIEVIPFHPNVGEDGEICLDILKENWTPIYNVRTLLLSVQQLLDDPNDADPLCSNAAQVYREGRDHFKSVSRKIHLKRERFLRVAAEKDLRWG